MKTVWEEIERTLIAQYGLAHNRRQIEARGSTPEAEVTKKLAEIKSGLASVKRREFEGPYLLLRVVGSSNRVYSGEWWFDAGLLDGLEKAYSRIYFRSTDRKQVLRDMLRELLAVSSEWNSISEVWALELPAGESSVGYVGPGNRQMLFANQPVTAKGNRLLVGKASQVYFPVKNPLWIRKHMNLG